MFLDAVILVLQEVLEAALLLSVLLVVNQLLDQHFTSSHRVAMRWYGAALLTGTAGAALMAWAMPALSQWFDYVGPEIVNAFMQLLIVVCLYVHCLLLQSTLLQRRRRDLYAGLTLLVVIAFGVAREGSEILLYIDGIMGTPASLMPVLLGTGVATGIGVSAGVLLYYALVALPSLVALRTGMVLLVLFAGNMAAQVILLLTQANWLPYSPVVWDSSGLLTEFSVSGQLLYALVGYEATPSLAQVGGYIAAMLLIISTPLFRRCWRSVRS